MEALKAQRIMLNRQPLSELLPYLSYEERSGLYILDHGIGFVFECSPLIFAGIETANTMRGLFESFFPPGTSIQFMIFGSRRIRYLLDAFVLYRENAHGDSLYSEMARKRRDFLLEGTEHSLFKGFDLRVRDFRLYVSVVIPTVRTPGDYEKMIEKARGDKGDGCKDPQHCPGQSRLPSARTSHLPSL